MLNRICGIFTKLMPLWVVLAGIIGFYFPHLFVIFKTHIDWLFALTMLGMGMVLNFKDFQPILSRPRDTALGVMAQFAIMPALALLIAKTMRLPPAIALGLIIAGAVPDAMAAGVISYLAKADVPYSIALTTSTTFLSPILTPAFTYLYGSAFIEVPFWGMFLSIIMMIIVPLLLGLSFKHFFKAKLERITDVFPAFSSAFIAVICGLVVALNRQHLAELSPSVFISVILLNFFGLVLGYAAGKLYRFDKIRCRTLSVGVGMQNAGLGAVLSIKHFSAQAALPNALFATWCILTAAFLAQIWSRRA